MSKYKEIKNNRVIKAKYLGATNTKGARIVLTEERFGAKDRIVLSVWNQLFKDKKDASLKDMSITYLQSIGLNLIGYGSIKDEYYFLSDNWGEDFILLDGSTNRF